MTYIPSTPPAGAAGGDLSGTYPNPTIGTDKVVTAKILDANVTLAKLANLATQKLIGRNTGSTGVPEAVSLTQLLDWIGSAAQGDILYRGATGWERLGAGTSGKFLKTQGAAANPMWDAPTAAAHATTHQPGGGDAMAVDAAAATGSLRTIGTGALQACAGNDSRLSDSRTPTFHASSHLALGSDPIKLDDLAAPDDNTDLDVSTTKHGLVPKAPNSVAQFLRGDATWAIPTVTPTPDPQVIFNMYCCTNPFPHGAL